VPLFASIIACSVMQTGSNKPIASWANLINLSFEDIWYLAMNDSLNRNDISTESVIDEYIYTHNNTAKEYESRKLTKFNIDGYRKEVIEKIKSRNFDYNAKRHRFFSDWKVGEYSQKYNGFLMFDLLWRESDYRGNRSWWNIQNPTPRDTYTPQLFSRDSAGKGSFEAHLYFYPYFILPISIQRATEALIKNYDIRNNLLLPVMSEYTIEHCGVIQGSFEHNGYVYCVINIEKAFVYSKKSINEYDEPINILQPIDIKSLPVISTNKKEDSPK
jgi:hypothetical protein